MSDVPSTDELKELVDQRLEEILWPLAHRSLCVDDEPERLAALEAVEKTIAEIKAHVLPLVYMATVLETIGTYTQLSIGLVDEVAQQFALRCRFSVESEFEEQQLPPELVPQPKADGS